METNGTLSTTESTSESTVKRTTSRRKGSGGTSRSRQNGNELLTARETMEAPDNRELPVLTLTYTQVDGRKAAGEFTDYERCVQCGRNQPTEFMRTHMAWDHG